MYASFLNLPVEGRHSRALHLKLFTVPAVWTTFYGVIIFVLTKTFSFLTVKPKIKGLRKNNFTISWPDPFMLRYRSMKGKRLSVQFAKLFFRKP